MAMFVAGCGAEREQPLGLDGTTTDPVPTETAAATGPADGTPPAEEPDGDPSPEPEASFTQPNVPGDEPRVVQLDEELAVEPPADDDADDAADDDADNADDDQRDVLRAVGRFMASWQAVLFGADEERSAIGATATGNQLDQLRDFIRDAKEQEWVFTGDPMGLRARSVKVTGDAAEVDLCIGLPNWVEIRGGQVKPYNAQERYTIEMERVDGEWLAGDSRQLDVAECDAPSG